MDECVSGREATWDLTWLLKGRYAWTWCFLGVGGFDGYIYLYPLMRAGLSGGFDGTGLLLVGWMDRGWLGLVWMGEVFGVYRGFRRLQRNEGGEDGLVLNSWSGWFGCVCEMDRWFDSKGWAGLVLLPGNVRGGGLETFCWPYAGSCGEDV